MNTEIINKLKASLDAINIDTDPFAFATESFTEVLDDGAVRQIDDNRLKVSEDRKKYASLEMATNDVEMFFDIDKATKTDLIKLLNICDYFGYCDLSNDFILALVEDDKRTAKELKPEFSRYGDKLADITSATLNAWIGD